MGGFSKRRPFLILLGVISLYTAFSITCAADLLNHHMTSSNLHSLICTLPSSVSLSLIFLIVGLSILTTKGFSPEPIFNIFKPPRF